ncbi:helix-turn-helix domain-containing protein [Photorhabdus laumondii]|uniref:helix-turn-helix domain-containing protein n=1 Tax=Photorhabdus laumondii TaxID=2218628 RepID=UPI0025B1424A|nr:helix-turn-helix domain-containing protein [Photorhabdus laumondii]
MVKKRKEAQHNMDSFEQNQKETFKERLLYLIGSRSVRTAAKEWGLSYSTLNNYIIRDSIPALNVAQSICDIEGVTLDWLATGDHRLQSHNQTTTIHEQLKSSTERSTAWQSILDSLEDRDVDALIKLIHRKGIEGILAEPPKTKTSTIEDTINELPIRETLKQAIKMALAGNESTDKEILRCITTLVSQETNKN